MAPSENGVAERVQDDEDMAVDEEIAAVPAEDAAGEDGDEDDGEGDEEYEVDQIKQAAKQGKNGWQYLVSWVGYGQEHDSWVNEADFGSMDIVDAYWKAKGGKPKGPAATTSKRTGRGSVAPSTDASASGRKRKASPDAVDSRRRGGRKGKAQNEPDDEDDDGGEAVGEYAQIHTGSMDAYKDLVSWEDQVLKIETVERGANGKLVVYLLMKGGEKTAQEAETIYTRCPRKMFEFYESHLKWRPVK